jgi:hypothetical protein
MGFVLSCFHLSGGSRDDHEGLGALNCGVKVEFETKF